MSAETTFTPSDKAREVFKGLSGASGDAMMERFFELWEAEGESRKAGSMAAHAFVRNAARIAVFGAVCGGYEPNRDLWMQCCGEAFDQAVIDVAKAFEIDDEQKEGNQCQDKSGS